MDEALWNKGIGSLTPLATPDGWVKASDVQPGTHLFGADGTTRNVLAVWRGSGPGFTVGLNGKTTLAGGPGLVLPTERRPNGGRNKRSQDSPTQLADMPGNLVSYGARVFRLAVAEPLILPDRDLPIDPYVLGAWLGDGDTNSANMAGIDPEIPAAFEAAGYPVKMKTSGRHWRPRLLQAKLRSAGVLGAKHIPAAYLRASEPQRRALLQGIMDTDGNCEVRGICELTTIRPVLRDGVIELLHTLGYKCYFKEGDATLYGRITNRKYRVTFSPRNDRAVFRLERKQSRVLAVGRSHAQSGHRRIECIEPLNDLDLVAIAVDGSNQTFLAGPAMIPVLGIRP